MSLPYHVPQEGRWNDSPCNQSLPSICKKAGRLSQGAAEEDHGCRKVRVFLELPKVGSPRGSKGLPEWTGRDGGNPAAFPSILLSSSFPNAPS